MAGSLACWPAISGVSDRSIDSFAPSLTYQVRMGQNRKLAGVVRRQLTECIRQWPPAEMPLTAYACANYLASSLLINFPLIDQLRSRAACEQTTSQPASNKCLVPPHQVASRPGHTEIERWRGNSRPAGKSANGSRRRRRPISPSSAVIAGAKTIELRQTTRRGIIATLSSDRRALRWSTGWSVSRPAGAANKSTGGRFPLDNNKTPELVCSKFRNAPGNVDVSFKLAALSVGFLF